MNNDTAMGETVRDWLIGNSETPQNLSDMEDKIRRALHWLGNIVLHLWLMSMTMRYPPKHRVCPHCKESCDYREKRWSKFYTMFGVVRCRRAYYLCTECDQGHYPLDMELGLRPNAMSAEVERLAAMVGVQMPFAKGRDIFEELTLISLSDQSLDKASQAYGRESQQCEAEQYTEAMDSQSLLERERDQSRPLRLYGAIDGGQVHVRGAEGEDHPWRELKVGSWFTAKGQPPKTPKGK